MKNSFFLVIPTQHKKPDQEKAFEERALQQWIQELPTANPGLSTRLLHDLIKEFNNLRMEPQKRLEALESLRSSFLIIEDYLRSRLIKSGFPKGQNEQKIFQVLATIEREFAIGYWVVARELTRRSISWLKGKHTALAIQRVMKSLSNIILTHYLMGRAVPEWVWMDLHSLYKLSVKIKKESNKVQDDTCAFGSSTTILDTYKQILLLSLAEPAGLMQKEMQQVYWFIERICSYVLLEDKPVPIQTKQCLILIDEDRMPFWSDAANEDQSDSDVFYINFSTLHKALNQPNKFINDNHARFSSIFVIKDNLNKLPPELIHYLDSRWSGIYVQGMPLFMDRLDRLIAIGLNAIYDFQNPLSPPNESSVEYLAESSSERSLSCEFPDYDMLSIGSLVSYRKTDMPKHMRSLGVVNKIVIGREERRLAFELQAICHQSHPVTFTQLHAEQDEERQKALLYALKEDGEEKSYIIMESFLIKNGDVIRLYMNEQNFPILLVERKNVGLGYWQFHCRQVAEPDKPATSKKGYDFI